MSPLGHSPIDRLMDAVDRMRPPAAAPLRRQGCWAAACLLLAAAVITLCSKSSPLYPFNDWVDANCYLTIGHGILRGQMPYRDLIDHKGPLLYLLHAPAAALDPAGFFGVYLLEILAAAGFLLAALCLLRLYGGRRMALALPLLAAVVYGCGSFCHGDSAEELCLPLLAWPLYWSLRAVRAGKIPPAADCLKIGLCAGAVLWIKFSLLGLFAGLLPVPILLGIRRRQGHSLLIGAAAALGGLLAITLPLFVWLACGGALDDCLSIYLHDNLFLYSSSAPGFFPEVLFNRLINGLSDALPRDPLVFPLILLGGAWLALCEKSRAVYHLLCAFFGLLLTVYGGGRHYPYYALPFTLFTVFGFAALRQLPSLRAALPARRGISAAAGVLTLALSLSALWLYAPNAYMRAYSREELPQFRFAATIAASEERTLLSYGCADGGFYTAAGAEPVCRYFCTLNLPLADMHTAQREAVDEGRAAFLVIRNTPVYFDNYRLLDTASFPYEGRINTYYLYGRR